MTHRILLAAATAACGLAAGPALAQDVADWNGFYIGANIGAAWGDTSIKTGVAPGTGTIVIPPADANLINQTASDDGNKTGFTGGGQVGYNYQMGSLILGIEADFGALDVNQQRTNSYTSTLTVSPPIIPAPAPVVYTIDQRVTTGWIFTVRPRIGYASDAWMVYATGGLAVTDAKVRTKYTDTRNPPNQGNSEESKDKTGWTAGVGGAYMFMPNWSVKGEYLYADFGSIKDTFASPNGFINVTSTGKVRANILRIGVDYKF